MKVQASILDAFRGTIARHAALELISLEIFEGPNPYSERGTALCRLEMNAAAISAGTLCTRLRTAFPDCFRRRPGATKGKADAAAAAACVAELAAGLLGANGRPDAASGSIMDRDSAIAWIEHSSIIPGFQALKVSLAAIAGALEAEDRARMAAAPELRRFESACARRTPNFDTGIMIAAARRRGIPYSRLGKRSPLWQFGWGARSECFWVTASNADGMVAQRISRDKELAKRFLRQLGIPTPDSRVVRPDEDFRPAVEAIGWPCAVKPLVGGGGKGVSANITDMESAGRAVAAARRFNVNILIERHLPGDDHRLMVIDGRFVAAVRRTPPAVIGDGESPIGALIDALNQERRKGYEATGYLEPVAADESVAATLSAQGFDWHSIPAMGERVLLKTSSSRSGGGTCEDVTDRVHPQIREMAQHCAAAFGFRATGIDYITTDIGRSFDDAGGGIVELNTTPGTRTLLAAGSDPDEVGAQFLGSNPGRIPVTLLVAPSDSIGSIERQLAACLSRNFGMTTSTTARIGDFLFPDSVQDAAARATMLLCYPEVERLLILWTNNEVREFGLPVDHLDSTILLNASFEDDWIEVLRRHSAKFRIEKSLQKAVSAGLGANHEQ